MVYHVSISLSVANVRLLVAWGKWEEEEEEDCIGSGLSRQYRSMF